MMVLRLISLNANTAQRLSFFVIFILHQVWPGYKADERQGTGKLPRRQSSPPDVREGGPLGPWERPWGSWECFLEERSMSGP